MTVRLAYRGVMTEINKTDAPNILLEDFNYLLNKAIYLFINKKYNIYDINLLVTDDIRVLKSTTILLPTQVKDTYNIDGLQSNSLYGAIYETYLPLDYLHILNCICNFKSLKSQNCYNENSYIQVGAKRLTSDMWSLILRNYYMKPSYRNPYYYINNVNSLKDLPTNPIRAISKEELVSTDLPLLKVVGTDGSLPTKIIINGQVVSSVNLLSTNRYGNPSLVRLEIRFGKDSNLFELTDVIVEYIKTPQKIELTHELLEIVEDTSQIMEFPDYVCQEIINELVKLLLENSSDPRLSTNLAVNQTIAPPIQQLSQFNKK